jgi:pilus assembly protein CpaF
MTPDLSVLAPAGRRSAETERSPAPPSAVAARATEPSSPPATAASSAGAFRAADWTAGFAPRSTGPSPIPPSSSRAPLAGDLPSGITERVRQQFAAEGVEATPAAIVDAVRRDPDSAVLGDTTVLRLAGKVHDHLVGAGPLAPLLADPRVTDVLVNGVEVWVDRGAGLQRAEPRFETPDEVRRLAQRLAAACGRRLDDGQPYADARLPDGTRLHAVLPPVATSGPYVSLRTFRQRPFTLDDLVSHGTVPAEIAELLAAIVAARLAYLVTGGTGSGKTTLLGTLLGLVPAGERIVLVEDAAELRPEHPHVVALQTRTANVEGAGTVGLTDLVRQALRMRPDRLVIGECRGAEIVDLLGALNTGHDGGAGTLHANTPADVPARLEALGLLGGLPRAALHAQVVAALQVVIQMRRGERGRVLESISVLLPAGADRLATVVTAWQRGAGNGRGAEALAAMIRARGLTPPPILTDARRGPMAQAALVPSAAADRAAPAPPVPAVPRVPPAAADAAAAGPPTVGSGMASREPVASARSAASSTPTARIAGLPALAPKMAAPPAVPASPPASQPPRRGRPWADLVESSGDDLESGGVASRMREAVGVRPPGPGRLAATWADRPRRLGSVSERRAGVPVPARPALASIPPRPDGVATLPRRGIRPVAGLHGRGRA